MSVSYWAQTTFQDSSSPTMSYIMGVYDWIMVVVLVVISVVLYVLVSLFMLDGWNRMLVSAEMLEFIWAGLPALFLGVLAIPSLHCLYLMEEVSSPFMSIKAIGHQWYWTYEYTDWVELDFDCYMMADYSLFRLLETDNVVSIPLGSEIRILVTSSDVIHSWTIPSMGVKTDAVPGRLNQIILMGSKLGNYYGQCSEMCGANHSFMPIVLQVLPKNVFLTWMK